MAFPEDEVRNDDAFIYLIIAEKCRKYIEELRLKTSEDIQDEFDAMIAKYVAEGGYENLLFTWNRDWDNFLQVAVGMGVDI